MDWQHGGLPLFPSGPGDDLTTITEKSGGGSAMNRVSGHSRHPSHFKGFYFFAFWSMNKKNVCDHWIFFAAVLLLLLLLLTKTPTSIHMCCGSIYQKPFFPFISPRGIGHPLLPLNSLSHTNTHKHTSQLALS